MPDALFHLEIHFFSFFPHGKMMNPLEK